ncbi:MAG: DUF839 domain-containing protein [Vicinamibacterales bacterium]
MRLSPGRTWTAITGGVLATGIIASAHDRGLTFSDFTPLAASAGATADESQPITLGNPAFEQRSIADRASQLAAGIPNSGNWDMNTLNETGRRRGRFLFTVFETGQAGIQRHDLRNGTTDTLWMTPFASPDVRGNVSFDASYWTPWGTFITAEESWGANSPYGRLFELRNPLDAPAIFGAPTTGGNGGADLVHRNVVPRTSHEGIQFDGRGHMYFVDELNGGAIYRYTPAASMGRVMSGKAEYFSAGQTAVLRVGDGATPNATGAYEWIPLTDRFGHALPGAVVVTDPNGVTSVDARATADAAVFKGTDYQRPEDLQIQRVRGRDHLYVTTTTTHEIYRLDLDRQVITVFADRNTIDLATGAPVGSALANPDNLAVDHDGNIYIVEDRNGAVDDDIWFAYDRNKDGDLTDPGEGIGRWASNGTPGSEFTGLYFDPDSPHRAWVNIQHPASGVDRTIEIAIPHGRRGHDDGDRDDRDDRR